MEATLHVRLDKTLRGDLEKIAAENGLKLSPAIRIAIEEYVERGVSERTTSRINQENF